MSDRDPDDFVEAVLELVALIPPGRVMSYGGVAAALGSRAARQVGKIMAHGGGELPWWRVIRADGRPPQGHERSALEHYELEGTPLRRTDAGYRVDLRAARWRP